MSVNDAQLGTSIRSYFILERVLHCDSILKTSHHIFPFKSELNLHLAKHHWDIRVLLRMRNANNPCIL